MTISSRTPEGEPLKCAICGEVAAVEPSYPGGDACCPKCGSLVWRVRDIMARTLKLEPERLAVLSAEQLATDSLDAVELVMNLEEEFDIDLPDDAVEKIRTVDDAIRYILGARREWD